MKFPWLPMLMVLLIHVVTPPADAACNGKYADDIINARFSECKKDDDVATAVHNWDAKLNNKTLESAITAVCKDGCYDAVVNPDLRPECRAKYIKALEDFSAKVVEIGTELGCEDSGAFPVDSKPGSASNDEDCRWVMRSTQDLTCGDVKSKQNNICGSGGRAICNGTVVCTKPVTVKAEASNAGTPLEPGVYSVACLTKTGLCNEVTPRQCMEDTDLMPWDEDAFVAPELQQILEKSGVAQ